MLFKETSAVYSEDRMWHVSMRCGQRAFNVHGRWYIVLPLDFKRLDILSLISARVAESHVGLNAVER